MQEAAPTSQKRAAFALGLLTLAYTLNFLDRQIVNILLVPIQQEFGVSDTAMGALAGICFALLFTVAGIPIARWADRGVRRDILALGLCCWSAMTACCGLAGSFVQLAAARVGVGIGEASCVPAAHSLISDLYPRERRTAALAVFSSGIHVGILCGLVLGGWIAQHHGWRTAFVVAGLPGLLLALVLRVALREPPRVDAPAAAESSGLRASIAELLRQRRFLLLAGAATCTSVVGYGFSAWNPALLARVHHMQTGEIGLWLGLISGGGGAVGAILFGWLAQRLARQHPERLLAVPACALGAALLFYAAYLLCPTRESALWILLGAHVCAASWFGPVFAATQNAVPPQRRALAASVLLLMVTLVGLGLGPTLVGFLNDQFRPALQEHAVARSLLVLLVFELGAVGCLVRAVLDESRGR